MLNQPMLTTASMALLPILAAAAAAASAPSATAFIVCPPRAGALSRRVSQSSVSPLHSSSFRSSEYDGGGQEDLADLRDRAANAALLERIFAPAGDGAAFWSPENVEAGIARRNLVELELAGRGSMTVRAEGREEGDDDSEKDDGEEKERAADSSIPCLFLAAPSDSRSVRSSYSGGDSRTDAAASMDAVSALPVPLPPSSYTRTLRLLSNAYSAEPISKSLCLTLNPLLTNRDNGLWDNLPWNTWSVDPLLRNRDAAGNPIERKYHLGKRDAYNRMMGKDWPGRSLSLTNLVAKAVYLLEGDDDEDGVDDEGGNGGMEGKGTVADRVTFDEDAARILARRVLELEVREARSALAEAEQYLAMLRMQYGLVSPSVAEGSDEDGSQGDDSDMDELLWSLPDNSDRWTLQGAMDDVMGARCRAEEAETALEAMLHAPSSSDSDDEGDGTLGAGQEVQSILRQFLSYLTSNQIDAPYRGAIGYAPVVDSKEDMFVNSVLPYTGPYDLLLEIIGEQLNADVIGTVVENTSLFEERLVLGGAVILRRRGVKKSIQVEGRTLELEDEDDELGNEGVRGGETFVVECDADEAVGVALAAGLPVCVERTAWEGARIQAGLALGAEMTENVWECIPLVEPKEDEASLRSSSSSTNQSSDRLKPEAPRSDDPFADFFRPKPRGMSMFPTDNPVTSLGQYDSLNVQDKARILLSLDSFKGRLPRPRALRNAARQQAGGNGSSSGSQLDPLDRLLIPLIDESVRRRLLLRDAESRGDTSEAERLRRDVSKRQQAKERAERAMEEGREEVAEYYEDEAEFLGELRADVTQDEGAYSRFLDKDEWYERDRLARAKRIDKKKFGSLLDGTGLE